MKIAGLYSASLPSNLHHFVHSTVREVVRCRTQTMNAPNIGIIERKIMATPQTRGRQAQNPEGQSAQRPLNDGDAERLALRPRWRVACRERLLFLSGSGLSRLTDLAILAVVNK